MLVRLSEHLSIRSRQSQLMSVTSFIQCWNAWLREHRSAHAVYESFDKVSDEHSATILRESCQAFVQFLLELDLGITLLTLQSKIQCPKEIAQQQVCFVGRLVGELEACPAFPEMVRVTSDLQVCDKEKLDQMFPLLEEKLICSIYDRLTSIHLATILFLAWPDVGEDDQTPVCRVGCFYGHKRDSPPSETLASELCALQEQLLVVLNFREKFICNSNACVMPE